MFRLSPVSPLYYKRHSLRREQAPALRCDSIITQIGRENNISAEICLLRVAEDVDPYKCCVKHPYEKKPKHCFLTMPLPFFIRLRLNDAAGAKGFCAEIFVLRERRRTGCTVERENGNRIKNYIKMEKSVGFQP